MHDYFSDIETLPLFAEDPLVHFGYVPSPMNYIGGKYRVLPQILPLFPKNIETFVDLFCGGCNVGVNVDATHIIFNDNLTFLIDLYKSFQQLSNEKVFEHIENQIRHFELSLTNEAGYKQLRTLYNTDRNPLDLFVLVAYSFNHQIRFNNSHEFNNPFGRDRSSFNPKMQINLNHFLDVLHTKNIEFTNKNFDDFNFEPLTENDFVYCDPPYLITTGTYNDGKRGFTGWSEKEEKKLLTLLSNLNERNIKFGLSNVLVHKGKTNSILLEWVKEKGFCVTHIDKNYSNSNYHTIDRDKNATDEVLITNYLPIKPQLTLDF